MSTAKEELEHLRAWAEVLDDSSYYELLGVLDLADGDAIKTAFHEFALAFHPDIHVGGTEETKHVARCVFRRGAEAYRVLSDPALRAKYDLALAGGYLRLVAGEPTSRAHGKVALQSLEDICKTPAARSSARRADDLIGQGRLSEARAVLKDALSQEGYENPILEDRIEALDLAIFATGG